MKNCLFCLLLCLVCIKAVSRDTLGINTSLMQSRQNTFTGIYEVSRFISPAVHIALLKDKPAVMGGAAGAIMLNYRYFFGAYGLYKINPVRNESATGSTYQIGYWHFGFFAGANIYFNPRSRNKRIHPTVFVLAGAGAVTSEDENQKKVVDQLYILKPCLGIEINVSKNVRIGTGFTYTFSGKANQFYTNKDISKPGIFFDVKLRWFSF